MGYPAEVLRARAAASDIHDHTVRLGDRIGDWVVLEVLSGAKKRVRLQCRKCLHEKTAYVYNLRVMRNECLWRPGDPRRHRGRPGR